MIAMVAGGEVRLATVDSRVIVTADRAIAPDPERWAVVQAGTLDAGAGRVSLTAGDAYSLAINHSGITRAHDIEVAGGDGSVVEVSGELDASATGAGETGGRITVLGDQVGIGAATLDASGDAGGGEIRVGGDLQGGGDLRTARRTIVSRDAALRADALTTGDGGTIIVWSDEATRFYGALSARGGAVGGDGGFAEISGASLDSRGSVDLGASAGSTGTLLYDPKDIVLHAGALDGTDAPDASDTTLFGQELGQVWYSNPGEDFTPFDVYESELEGTNANILLQATNSISSTESFAVQLVGSNSLAMVTRNAAGDETGTTQTPGIHLAGVSFSTTGGDISLTTGNGSIEVGDLSTRGADGATGGAGGDVAITAGNTGSLTVGAIDASGGTGSAGRGGNGGTIRLVADLDPNTTASGTGARVVTVNGDLSARGGSGTGAATDTIAEGGSGGQIAISAGVVADQGSVVLGSLANPVRLDASGGNGTAGGGDASITAIQIAARGDVDAHAELVATGGDTSPSTGPGGFGGQGGGVSITTEAGSVTLADTGAPAIVAVDGGDGRTDTITITDGVPRFDGQGGSAGRLDVTVAGAGEGIAVLGGVSGTGGSGTLGAGGAGATVTLTADDGPIALADVAVSGGSGTGSVTTAEGATTATGVKGGSGGSVTITAEAGEGDTAAGGGDVSLGGSIVSLGGAGVAHPDGDIADPNENHGTPGAVRITSPRDIAAGVGAIAPSIQAGTIALDGRNVFPGSGTPLLLASSGATAPASFVDTATVTAGRDETAATGDVRVRLDDSERFDRFEVVETDARGSVNVLREDGATVIARGTGAGTVHTIEQLTTNATDPHFTYRLADPIVSSSGVEQIDITTLAVASGAVSLGASGGTLANSAADSTQVEGERLLGRIQGSGAGPHVTTAGNLQVFATNIGDETPLGITGSGPNVELGAAGVVRADVGGTIARVDLVQRSAAGDTNLTLPGGGAAVIDGSVIDTGASLIETSRITSIDTRPAGTEFYYHLADNSVSSDETTSGEPVLSVASGAVTAGGTLGLAATGEIELERGAIDAGGETVVLVADSDRDSTGAIDALATGTAPHVANAGALVAIAGSGVGTEAAPLRTSGSAGKLALAGSGGTGDFRIANEAGRLSVERIPLTGSLPVANAGTTDTVTYRGLYAGGAVVLDNSAACTAGPCGIELGDVQEAIVGETLERVTSAPSLGLTGTTVGTDLRYGFGDLRIPIAALTTATASAPTVQSGGSQRYVGPVELSADSALVAGSGVTFENDVDSIGLIARDLDVRAGGTTTFGANVGTSAPLDRLAVTDAEFTAGVHTVNVASGDFRAIDGPGSLELRGVGTDSRIEIRDNVGARTRLSSFDADAELIVFSSREEGGALVTSADRVVADSIALNDANPSTDPAATIADTTGGLSLESAGDVVMGAGEKLSSTGPLVIRAGGTAALSDLAASELVVDAPQIVMRGRDPGPVEQPGGTLVQDNGVDWVANDITTTSVPQWDGVGTPPTFVLGSGGIILPGPIPHDVIRFTAAIDEIRPESFAGDGHILDLTGLGPRVVSDARRDVPQATPPVLPGLAARPGDEPPSPPRVVSSQEVIAALHCRTAVGDVCVPPVGDDPLATERAHEIVKRYRWLVASDEAVQSLRASFAPLASMPSGDVDALSRALAHDPAAGEARARIGELAVTLAQVELLGLDEQESERVRREIASEFASASGVAGLGADAVLAAVEASGVAALP